MTGLSARLVESAGAGRLLVIADYDGVIAPIVNDPAAAYPDPAAKAALLRLAELDHTYVAVLSGRARDSLVSLLGDAPGVTVVGSHGAEGDEPLELTDEQADTLAAAVEALREIASTAEGTSVEEKPSSVALHVRNADPSAGAGLVEAVRSGPGSRPGIRAVEGKEVIELLVSSIHKGDAVRALRRRFEPDRIIVLGDDVTDEDAFTALAEVDLGIKVGTGATAARGRVPDQADVAGVLDELAAVRLEALESGTGPENTAGSLG